MWQDGTLEENVPSTEVETLHNLDENEFFPGEFVVDNRKENAGLEVYGVVQRADFSERTCFVRWFSDAAEDRMTLVIFTQVDQPFTFVNNRWPLIFHSSNELFYRSYFRDNYYLLPYFSAIFVQFCLRKLLPNYSKFFFSFLFWTEIQGFSSGQNFKSHMETLAECFLVSISTCKSLPFRNDVIQNAF